MPAMDEAVKKAFDFAQETTKQILTLATGIFALTLTFLKDIATTKKAKDALVYLHWGWVLYLVSVLFGVMTLMALTGNLQRPQKTGEHSIYAGNIRALGVCQIVVFFAALILTLIFGIAAT
jgi:hypothetical protein